MDQYNIVLSGDLLAGFERAAVVEAFAKAFKCTEIVANEKVSGKKLILKKSLELNMAERFQKALTKMGIESYLEETAHDTNVPGEIILKDDEAPAISTAAQSTETPDKFEGYTFTIEGNPDYSFVTVQLPANDTLKVEASAMATMDTNMVMKTKMRGGLARLLTSESMFINEFTAEGGPGEIGIAPGAPGALAHVYLKDDTIFLQSSAFVASAMGVNVETKWQGLTKGFFSGESLFLIRCSGQGDLWFNTYGGIIEIDVSGNYVVDTGNIVAFTEGLDYRIKKVGGYKSLFFSGEGFVCRFTGKGRVWIQTRDVGALATWVHPFRRSGK